MQVSQGSFANDLGTVPIHDLYVYPTYAVKLLQRPRNRPSAAALARANEERARQRALKLQNDATGLELVPVLSHKAQKRLTNSVNWLISSAKTQRAFSKSTGKSYSFKVNFITLTLPTLEHGFTDNQFKSILLHGFINTCRSKFGLKNFVWKVEAQENGNIHAHFTTDCFMDWAELRIAWNTILSKHGILSKYTDKHKNLSFEDYNALYNPQNKTDLAVLQKAYAHGVKTAWASPNTTDVHAVHKVKDIGAYLAKYLGKSETDRRRIQGRVWSCNYALSAKNKLIVECCGSEGNHIIDTLNHPSIKVKLIESVNRTTGSITAVGVLYLYKLSDWGSILNGKLLDHFNAFRFGIRNGTSSQADMLAGHVLPASYVDDLLKSEKSEQSYHEVIPKLYEQSTFKFA